MRTCFLAVAGLVLIAQVGCAGVNLAQKQGDGNCMCPQCQAARMAQQQAATTAPQQQPESKQPVTMEALQGPNGEIMLVGHHAAAAACPPGYGNGYGGYGPHSYAPGAPHPGRPFDGGWYGWHGAAHGTPGYPHRPHHMSREYVGPPGPPVAQVAYPYYTTRGPRDFLIDNPPTIGR